MPKAIVRVYIADDHRGTREMLKDLACPVEGGQKWQVKTFGYAEALFEAAGQRELAVVITDIHFGPDDMDGLTLIEMLKEEHPKVKIIVHSGSTGLRFEAIEAGADEFLPKPLNSLEDLETVIQRLLESRTSR